MAHSWWLLYVQMHCTVPTNVIYMHPSTLHSTSCIAASISTVLYSTWTVGVTHEITTQKGTTGTDSTRSSQDKDRAWVRVPDTYPIPPHYSIRLTLTKNETLCVSSHFEHVPCRRLTPKQSSDVVFFCNMLRSVMGSAR